MSPRPNGFARALRRFRGSAAFAILVSSIAGVIGTSAVSVAAAPGAQLPRPRWSADERTMLKSLSLTSLQPLAPDPSNKYGDDPRAAALGRELFFDTRLSGNSKVSCASCHVPTLQFQDDSALGHGVGVTARRTMPVAATARSPWQFWDGRSDSQWSQALGPLESAVEHGGTRTQYARLIADHYRAQYEETFGVLPDVSGLPKNA